MTKYYVNEKKSLKHQEVHIHKTKNASKIFRIGPMNLEYRDETLLLS